MRTYRTQAATALAAAAYRVLKFETESQVNAGILLGMTVYLTDLDGATPTQTLDFYLHGEANNNTHGSAPNTTFQKYSHEVTGATVEVDATDNTKGVVHYDFDEIPFGAFSEFGPLTEIHLKADRDTPNAIVVLHTRCAR